MTSINRLAKIVAETKELGNCRNSKKAFDSLDQVFGKTKVSEVCLRYGISRPAKSKAQSLKASRVRKLLSGLNDIQFNDVESFYKKIKENGLFTDREKFALKKLTTSDFDTIKSSSALNLLEGDHFNMLIDALRHPCNDFEKLTFRLLPLEKITPLPDKYFKHGWRSHKLGRAKEDEERLRLYQELESLNPNELFRYTEILSKLLVKKHLYYEQGGSHHIKMGMLIPGLKDSQGNPTWYKISEIMDSGIGKFAYRLIPATVAYTETMPDLILHRNSSTLPTALDSFTSYINDINVVPPGYLSRNTCKKQELKWLTEPTPTINNSVRPLLIVGHSLGGSNSQLALLNLQKSKQLPNRKIDLVLYDSPAIKASDARGFAKWVKKNNLEGELTFHYHISAGDPVPFAGHVLGSSYVGAGIEHQGKPIAIVHRMQLTRRGAKKTLVKGNNPHSRLFYRGKAGKDYKVTDCTVETFNKSKKTKRFALSALKSFGALFIWPTIGLIGYLKRVFIGRRHHSPLITKIFKKTH